MELIDVKLQKLLWASRQKEMATHSVTELVQAVRRPRSLSESTNRPFRKSGGGGRGEKVIEALARRNSESLPRRNSENVAPPRRNSLGDAKISMQCINEVPEKKQKKSRRRSFMGVIRKSQTQSQGCLIIPLYLHPTAS
ncbi:hypothetical protein ABKV19_004457 [Rosa sericea]